MSLVSWETPWKPATIAMWPSSIAFWMRPGVTSMILALPCALSVITPAWLPVNDRASWPRFPIAIASSAIEMRSPAVSSMSSSRPAGSGETCSARSISSSVVSPIAETTTTTSLPARFASRIRWATRLMPLASATDEPPYFCTTMPTTDFLGFLQANGVVASLPTRIGRAGTGDAWQDTRQHARSPVWTVGEAARPDDLRREQLVGRGDLVLLALELRIEPIVGDHRLERPQHATGLVAPGGDVGELPPPERLADAPGAVVLQAVGQSAGDAGQVVRQQRGDHLRRVDVGVEDLAVGIHALQQDREAQPHGVEVGVGAGIGF